MRLIDADALIEEIARIPDLRRLSTKTIGEALNKMPTVEPERKHGHWIIDTKFGADIMICEQMVICSECDKGIFWGKQNYCPNCGAEMEEGEQE